VRQPTPESVLQVEKEKRKKKKEKKNLRRWL
jgi:hypothetical protein